MRVRLCNAMNKRLRFQAMQCFLRLCQSLSKILIFLALPTGVEVEKEVLVQGILAPLGM